MTPRIERRSRVHRLLKSAYHSTRNLPDRVLHRTRHRDVKARLSIAPRPREILVVCYGNVCRSPYMQAVLQRALPDLVIKSAGFFGSDRSVPEISAALGGRRGLDLTSHRSRPLTQSTIRAADLIIVMDAYQARQIKRLFPRSGASIIVAGDLDPEPTPSRAITDPWNLSSDVFEASFDRLDRCAATLVSVLRPPA